MKEENKIYEGFKKRIEENQRLVDFISDPEAMRKAEENMKEMTKDYKVLVKINSGWYERKS